MNKRTPMKKTQLLRFAVLGVLLALGSWGCGGGGGGGAPAPPALTTPQGQTRGQAVFTVKFPPRGTPRAASGFTRQANVLPPETETVLVQVFAVNSGVRDEEPTEEQILERPSDAGGEVKATFVLPVGRYLVEIRSRDAEGNILGASSEPVRIEGQKVATVPTILGLVYGENGFTPSTLSLHTGDRLVVHHGGALEGDFRLSGIADCKATLARTGSLACTLRQPGNFTLRSPNSVHTAAVAVVQDDNLLATARPSMGIKRSEAIAESGPVVITFLLNNGGQAYPTGTTFDPGNGQAPIAVSQDVISVSYNAGGYIAQLLDAGGNALAQRYVVIHPPLSPPPTSTVVLNEVPAQVSESFVAIAGTTDPPVTGSVVVIESGEEVVLATTDDTGAFTASVPLDPGTNTLVAYVVNEDGVGGPETDATVVFTLGDGEPGVLAFIEIEDVEDIYVAGQIVTFTVTGYDVLGDVVAFTPQANVEGLEALFTGPTTFQPITAGVGELVVIGPGGVSASHTIEVEPGVLSQLSVSPGNVTVREGEALQFTVFGADQYGNVVGPPADVVWTGTDILSTVDATGSVTPGGPGYGVVTVTDGEGRSAQACVSVNAPPPQQSASSL